MAVFDLVLSSGGTKGLAFVGALEVLDLHRHTTRRLIGTSAGAVTAALVAAGYTGKELAELAPAEAGANGTFRSFLQPPPAERLRDAARGDDSETRRLLHRALERAVDAALEKVADKVPRVGAALKLGVGLVRKDVYNAAYDALFNHRADALDGALGLVVSFLEFGGFFGTEAFRAWLTGRIRDKVEGFDESWTLARFHQKTGRDLSVVAADTAEREALVLNHRSAPDCPLIQAVRMSMSVPMVWQEVVWEAGWGKYVGRPKTGHTVVDGGAVLNFPLRYVLEPDNPAVKRVMGDPPKGAALPLGLLIDSQLPVPGDVAPPQRDQSKVVLRLERLVDTVSRWEDEYNRLNEAVLCRIPAFGYAALEFADSGERVRVLIDAGRCAMVEHLRRRKV